MVNMSSRQRPSADVGPVSPRGQNTLDASFEKETDQDLTPKGNFEGLESNSRQIRGIRWQLICISLYITCFMYGLDTTIAADVQGPVIEEFGHVDQFSWIGAGFPLGSVCVILLLGTLFNTVNMKWVYIATVVLFGVGSAICGAAPGMNALIVGRITAGAGGSGIYLGSLQYFTLMTEEKERGIYLSLLAVFWGAGSVLGPLIGGAFAMSSATWRWAFYMNLIVGAISTPAAVLCLPPIYPTRDRLSSIDFVGFILGTGVWVSFLLTSTMAGGAWAWEDRRNITTLVVFGAFLVIYIVQQYFAIFTTPTQRAFPGHLLRDRTQILLSIVTAAGSTSVFVIIYYLPIYFQFVHNDGAFMAAIRLLPFVVVAIVVNLVSGSILQFVKLYKALFIISSVFLLVGGGLLAAYLSPSTKVGAIYGFSVLVAIGSGLCMVTGYTVSTLTLKSEETGAAIKLQNVSQIGGQVIALAISGQVYRSRAIANLQTDLAGHGYSNQEILGAVAGAQSKLFEMLDGGLRDKSIESISQAMQLTFVLIPVSGGVILTAAICMKWEKLFGNSVAMGS